MTNNSVTNKLILQLQAIFAMSSDCIMILDKMGTIVYLNNKADHLFGNDSKKIIGQPMGNLIPNFQLDQKGIIYAANKKFCDLSKYSKDELIGKDHRILNSGYHSRGFFRDMWKTIGTGNVWRGEICNKAKDGSLYWVNTTIVPLVNEQGKPYRYFSFRVDITEQKQIEADLQKALKDDFNTTVKNLENGVFKMSKDINGNLVYTMAEGKLLEKLGFRTGSMKHKTPFELFSIEIATYKNEKYKHAFQGIREHYEIELGGRLLYVDVSPIRQGEEVVELVGSVHDVTELRSTQKQLQENQLLYQSLYTLSQDAVFTLDKHDQVISVNPATENLLGYTQEDIVQKSLSTLLEGDYQKKYQLYFEKVLKGEPQNFDTAMYHKDGQIVHLNLTYLPISVDQRTMVIYSIGKDITRQKKTQELNAYLAHHDELTKLLNRRGFEGELKKAILNAEKSNQKFAVMYIDLDRFKNVNDTLGHFIGDRLLEEIAFRLKSQIGEGNWIARMGGDEFMVLCPVIHQEDSIYVANKILHCLKEPFFIDENELYLTASIGISTYPKNGDNVIDLMKHADIALYKAKDQGRNNYQIYSSIMDQSRYQSFIMERDLRKALIHDEFIFHLQPRVDSKTNKVISAEALIRWNHPKYGLISPTEFIPLAEETGIIIPIGKWMKRKVCEQLVKWQEAGNPVVPISINISAQRFLQKDFATSVSQILKEFQLEGSLLEFEITENSLMKNEEDVVRAIYHLVVTKSKASYLANHCPLKNLKNCISSIFDNLTVVRHQKFVQK